MNEINKTIRLIETKVLPVLEERFFIKEGLIVSYPKNVLARLINKLGIFDVYSSAVFSNLDDYNPGLDISLSIYGIYTKDFDKVFKSFLDIINSCGYYIAMMAWESGKLDKDKLSLSNSQLIDYIKSSAHDNGDLRISLEAKYDQEIDLTKTKFKQLFHCTAEKYLDKIKKIGLSPKSQGKKSKHPERVYLAIAKNYTIHLSQMLESEILLTINEDGMRSPRYRMFIDPNTEYGIYTYSNIEPSRIEKIEKIVD